MTTQKVPPKQTKTRAGRTGSVLLEGVFSIGITLITLSLNIELVRTAQQTILLRHACFLHARWRALGLEDIEARKRIARWVGSAAPRGAQKFMRQLNIEFIGHDRELFSKAVSRYASLFLPFRDWAFAADRLGPRDRIQFTKRCYFSSKRF